MSTTTERRGPTIPDSRFKHLRVGFALEAGDAAALVQLEIQKAMESGGELPAVDVDGLREDAMHALGYLVGFGQVVFGEEVEEVRSQLLLAAAAEAVLPLWRDLSEAGSWRYDAKAGARESVLRTLGSDAAARIREIATRVFEDGTAVDAPARQFVVTVLAHLEQLAGELRQAGDEELAVRIDEVVVQLDRRVAAADEIAELWCRYQDSRKPRTAPLSGAGQG